MTVERPWFLQSSDLTTINSEIWNRLKSAPQNRESGWRLPVLATVDQDQSIRQRIVVMRSVDVSNRTLFAHTDIRSAKISAIRTNPQTGWLFYESSQQVQLQVTGRTTIHTDDAIAERFWTEEPEASLRGYLASKAPGTACSMPETNLPEDVRNRIPERQELQTGRANFAVISCVIETAEWLLLQHGGNLRAVFEYSETGFSANWIAP